MEFEELVNRVNEVVLVFSTRLAVLEEIAVANGVNREEMNALFDEKLKINLDLAKAKDEEKA